MLEQLRTNLEAAGFDCALVGDDCETALQVKQAGEFVANVSYNDDETSSNYGWFTVRYSDSTMDFYESIDKVVEYVSDFANRY